MNKSIRSALRSLRRHFLRAADRFPDLFFELLTFDPRVLPSGDKQAGRLGSKVWGDFIEEQHDRKPETWEAIAFAGGSELGRFFGREEGLGYFTRLAESLGLVLNEMSPQIFSEIPIDHSRCLLDLQ